MNVTPIWVPLVVAVLGLVATLGGTLGGVIVAQRAADLRERESRAEQTRQERLRWAREDEARTFEQRRDAYIGFYEALRETVWTLNRAFDQGADPAQLSSTVKWDALRYRLHRVEMYGSDGIVALAQRAHEITSVWGSSIRRSPDDPNRVLHDEDLSYEADGSPDTFIQAVRKELRVPDGKPDLSS